MSKPEPTPAAPRLVSFKCDSGQLAGGINLNMVIHVDTPPGHLDGWSLRIRGPRVLLITPRGWTRDRSSGSRHGMDPKGRHRVFERPRTEFTFEWDTDDLEALDKLDRYDLAPMQIKRPEPEPGASDPTMGDP